MVLDLQARLKPALAIVDAFEVLRRRDPGGAERLARPARTTAWRGSRADGRAPGGGGTACVPASIRPLAADVLWAVTSVAACQDDLVTQRGWTAQAYRSSTSTPSSTAIAGRPSASCGTGRILKNQRVTEHRTQLLAALDGPPADGGQCLLYYRGRAGWTAAGRLRPWLSGGGFLLLPQRLRPGPRLPAARYKLAGLSV